MKMDQKTQRATALRERESILKLLSSLYLVPPIRESMAMWKKMIEPLAGCLSNLAKELEEMDLDDPGTLEDLNWEFTRLFIGPYRLTCPPWESVYTSPNRLLMQGAYEQVVEAYGQMGLAVSSPEIMADHIGAELNFAAILEERVALGNEYAREVAWKFREDHLKQWIPKFTADLESAADSGFYRALALDTRNLILDDAR